MEASRRPDGPTTSTALVVVAAAVLASTFDPPALADVSEAKERFEKGVALFKDADYQGALVEFEAAYEAQPNFKVKYNIGISLFKLHRYVEARAELESYLSEGGDEITEQERLQVQGMLYEMQTLIGSITVTCSVQEASVTVDGEDAGPCPFAEPLAVDLGEYVVEVVAAGHKKYKQSVTVAGGKAIVVNAALEAEKTAGQTLESGAAVTGPRPPGGYLSVESDTDRKRDVYVDGVLVGVTPLLHHAMDPGKHKVAVIGTKLGTSHYETVVVAAGQDLVVHAKTSKAGKNSILAIVLGTTFGVSGVALTITSGVIYSRTDPADKKDREELRNLTIGCAVIGGLGLLAAGLGIYVYTCLRKYDAFQRKKYLTGPEDKATLSLAPFMAPVDGGGVLGLTGNF